MSNLCTYADLRSFIFHLSAGMIIFCMAGGCSRSVASSDMAENNDSVMAEARARKEEGKIDNAIAIYKEIVNAQPKLARAHLDLAILLHDYSKDYLRALYHYERYLELRPKTEKKEMIENRVRIAKQLFAGAILHPNRDRQARTLESGSGDMSIDWASVRDASMRRIELLEQENEELRRKLSAIHLSD
ncbi:MAG: hypothetical protein JXN60_00785 [Lentisphaerae bacterium]|nr:hypothetical protein [Lentisphaerota bacterium]